MSTQQRATFKELRSLLGKSKLCLAQTTPTASPNTPIRTHPHVQAGAGNGEEDGSRKWWKRIEQADIISGDRRASPSSCLLFQSGRSSKEPLITGSSPWGGGGGGGLRSLVTPCGVSLMGAGGTLRGQMADSCVSLDGGRSSSAWTVTPTFTSPRSSRMWWGRHSLSCDAQTSGYECPAKANRIIPEVLQLLIYHELNKKLRGCFERCGAAPVLVAVFMFPGKNSRMIHFFLKGATLHTSRRFVDSLLRSNAVPIL